MMSNSLYNLANQLVQEHKSHWRIQNEYLKEAQSEEETMLWEKLAKEKAAHCDEIMNAIKTKLMRGEM